MEDVLASAVLDNATWCHRVCETHGIGGRFDADAWVSPRRTPPGYPDAVTLADDASGDALLDRIDVSVGCSVKDSFANIDLAEAGFRILFDAAWIWRPAGAGPLPAGGAAASRWAPVEEATELVAWADDHGGGTTFSPALLDMPSVVILAAHDVRGRRLAGAVATVGDGAVGISNVFAARSHTPGGPDAGPEAGFAGAFAGATRAVAERFPDLPIVGYLAGSRLAAARTIGYHEIGPLRVWLRDEP